MSNLFSHTANVHPILFFASSFAWKYFINIHQTCKYGHKDTKYVQHIIQERPQTWCTAPYYGVVSHAWGSNWGYTGFCWPHTQFDKCKTHPQSLCAVQHFKACLSSRSIAHTAVDAGVTYPPDKPRLFWLQKKTRIPPIWAPWLDQNGPGSWISLDKQT